MDNNGRLFVFLAFLLMLIPLAYFGCGNDGDDDSDDDQIDDDSSPEVGVFYRYVDFIDSVCPYNEHTIEIINPSICNEDTDPALPEGADFPYNVIIVHFDDEYVLEQEHGPEEQVSIDGDVSCRRGFDGYIILSEDQDDYVLSIDGYVDVQRLDDSNYRIEFEINFEDGSTQQGVWTAKPCGESVPY